MDVGDFLKVEKDVDTTVLDRSANTDIVLLYVTPLIFENIRLLNLICNPYFGRGVIVRAVAVRSRV